MSQRYPGKLILTRNSSGNLEDFPLSAPTFFSPGVRWMLRMVLHWICLMETNLMMSAMISAVEKQWLMFASAPVLSDPD